MSKKKGGNSFPSLRETSTGLDILLDKPFSLQIPDTDGCYYQSSFLTGGKKNIELEKILLKASSAATDAKKAANEAKTAAKIAVKAVNDIKKAIKTNK